MLAPTATAVAVIPARSGSKGVPGKNLLPLAGRSLIARAVDCAIAAGCFDAVVVSTDNEAYAEEARRAGAEVLGLRPAKLATDDTPMVDVIAHELAQLTNRGTVPAILAIVQPTSPLRLPQHLSTAVSTLRERPDVDSVVGVTAVPAALSPDYVMEIRDGYLGMFLAQSHPASRRQDVRRAYFRNGVVYAVRARFVRDGATLYGTRCVPLVLSEEFGLSIDTESDWLAAQAALSLRERR